MPIYRNNPSAKLNDDSYFDIFEDKGVKFITIKRSKNFKNVQGKSFELKPDHLWSHGDTLYKLSYKNYGTYDFWWTIALVNSKPTDAPFKIGDVVFRPRYTTEILELT